MNRWAVCALLFGATLLNYLDRQTVAVTAPLIRADLGIDLAGLGLVFSLFYWSYAAGQILVGFVIDRVSVKWSFAAAVAAWSLAGAAAGLATGLWSLALLRVALGLCEAANWPAALRVVAGAFPPRERSLANGIFQSGTSLGALIAPPLLVAIAEAWSWRAGFAIVGLAGFVWVAAWALLYRVPAPGHPHAAAAPPAAVTAAPPAAVRPARVGEILRSRRLWGLAIASAFLNPCLYFYVNWLPTYLVESGQPFGPALAGQLFVVYLVLDAGYISGGALVARLGRRMEVPAARRLVATAGTPLMASIVAVPGLTSLGAVLAVTSLAALGLGWFMVCYLASIQDVSRARVATVAGFLGAAGSIGGALFMALVGFVARATGSFAVPFLILAALPAIAIAGLWIGTTAPPVEPAPDARDASPSPPRPVPTPGAPGLAAAK